MFAAALPAISPQAVESFFALAIGFAFAGSCANGYRLFGEHFPSFRLLESGPAAAHRTPPRAHGHGGDGDRRPVEPDVRDRGGDGVRSRHPGLTDRRQATHDRSGELRFRRPSTGV
jgi:hypothetical protein